MRQWFDYRAMEGDGHRSDEFAKLASRLDETCFGGFFVQTRTRPADRATEIEVLSFLGLPDCGSSDGIETLYVYSYWRTDTKSRWVAIVQIKDGMLEQIGWNDATVSDFSQLKHYKSWSEVPGVVR
jgi:hypothetical protein